jgi:hypothetical protein
MGLFQKNYAIEFKPKYSVIGGSTTVCIKATSKAEAEKKFNAPSKNAKIIRIYEKK